MILDRLARAERYARLHPGFDEALAFLRRADLRELPLGKYPIDGERVYATIARSQARRREDACLEAHRRYIDIHLVLEGVDEMGWKGLGDCRQLLKAYDAELDCELFSDPPAAWIAVARDSFTVFFPEDAHAPVVGVGELLKVVVKIAV
jgi:YhcH/YjgK/YiaL family protein